MAKKKNSPKKKQYELIRNVKIDGELKKAGEKVSLTQQGYSYFRTLKAVK